MQQWIRLVSTLNALWRLKEVYPLIHLVFLGLAFCCLIFNLVRVSSLLLINSFRANSSRIVSSRLLGNVLNRILKKSCGFIRLVYETSMLNKIGAVIFPTRFLA